MDGASMQGAVCDLGFCSFADEVLQFEMRKFNGNWDKEFFPTFQKMSQLKLEGWMGRMHQYQLEHRSQDHPLSFLLSWLANLARKLYY
jgi:hypothetical protein